MVATDVVYTSTELERHEADLATFANKVRELIQASIPHVASLIVLDIELQYVNVAVHRLNLSLAVRRSLALQADVASFVDYLRGNNLGKPRWYSTGKVCNMDRYTPAQREAILMDVTEKLGIPGLILDLSQPNGIDWRITFLWLASIT